MKPEPNPFDDDGVTDEEIEELAQKALKFNLEHNSEFAELYHGGESDGRETEGDDTGTGDVGSMGSEHN